MRISQTQLPVRAAEPKHENKQPMAGHNHGWTGTALHVGHDVAMIGMSLPCCTTPTPQVLPPMEICGQSAPVASVVGHDHAAHNHAAQPAVGHDHSAHNHGAQPPAGHDHSSHDHGGHAGHGGTLNNAMAGLSAAVAVGSAIHGIQMIQSDDTLTKIEGANHLLMSASCGVMSAQMFGVGGPGLGAWSTGLMAAHGLGETALGAHQLMQGVKEDCAHHRLMGITKMVHGGCLAAAQAFPGAALPLYIAMGAATTVQIAMGH
jgi:hypothetical protein